MAGNVSSLLFLACGVGGFEGEKWRQLDFFISFKLSHFSLLSLPLSQLSSKEFII